MKIYFCDGGCAGNGKEIAKAYGSYCEDGKFPTCIEFSTNEAKTSNQAEYLILIRLLESIKSDEPIEICMDSQLVIYQLLGQWKIKHTDLRPFWWKAKRLIEKHGNVNLRWVRRDNLVRQVGH